VIRHHTPEFRRTTLALFSAGFATFALLYCVQPLMPVFAREFHVSAAKSSLPLSLTTGLLAPALIVAGVLSEARGRKAIMVASLLASSLLMVAASMVHRWEALLVLRALVGITFAGFPAASMAYLSEEVHPTSIGLSMGLTIGGNGLGGMTGRLGAAVIADAFSWRVAVGAVGILGLIATFVFWRTLPPSRHFTPRPVRVGALLRVFWSQLRERKLAALDAQGFLLMGALVTTYNYVAFHLAAPPYSLPSSIVGMIFIVYLIGIFASAWIGSIAGRVGRGRMLTLMIVLMLAGLGLTLLHPLAAIVIGIATVTFGFFGGHSVASAWVGLRATHAKAQAAALYLFAFYIGSSVAGSVGGLFWARAKWPGVVGFVGSMLVVALIAARAASDKSSEAMVPSLRSSLEGT
jgi:MFS transporter, YNFM family, putative membrane transport protein